ncbi:unnamed protein product, partial [Allacma fusca]
LRTCVHYGYSSCASSRTFRDFATVLLRGGNPHVLHTRLIL